MLHYVLEIIEYNHADEGFVSSRGRGPRDLLDHADDDQDDQDGDARAPSPTGVVTAPDAPCPAEESRLHAEPPTRGAPVRSAALAALGSSDCPFAAAFVALAQREQREAMEVEAMEEWAATFLATLAVYEDAPSAPAAEEPAVVATTTPTVDAAAPLLSDTGPAEVGLLIC